MNYAHGKSFYEIGRSMLEMLAVLAIIGVLSVGGISGFTKAVEEWKATKTSSEYYNLITNILMNQTKLRNNNHSEFFMSHLADINMLPNEWTSEKYGRSLSVYSDSMGNKVTLSLTHDLKLSTRERVFILSPTLSIGRPKDVKAHKKFCQKLISHVVKPMSGVLDSFYVSHNLAVWYGDKTPLCQRFPRSCINDLSLDTAETVCDMCSRNPLFCSVYLVF